MDSMPRERLRQLVVRFGPEIGRDSRRCEALLRDVCGSYKKEIFALSSAVKEGIPTEIGSPIQGVPPKILFARYAKRLHENLGISEDLCLWTVESWAYALGVVSKRDLQAETRCPICDTRIAIPGKLHGKPAKCPKCDARLLVSVDGSDLQLREEETQRPSSKPTEGQLDGQIAKLGIVQSETAEDLFRQIADRLVATSGLASANHPHLEQARLSLGLSNQTASQIVNQAFQQVFASQSQRKNLSASRNTPPAHPATSTNPPLPLSHGAWYLRTIDGGQYGPLDDDLIGLWAAEGRITQDTLVWREGWTAWFQAARVTFPSTAREFTPLAPANNGRVKPNSVPKNVPVPSALAARAENLSNIGVSSIAVGLCCCPPLGLLLSIIVLSQVGEIESTLRKCDDAKELLERVDGGKVCAILGLAASVIWFLIWLVVRVNDL